MGTTSMQVDQESKFGCTDLVGDETTTACHALNIKRKGSKRTLLRNSLLALPAATVMLGASHAAQVGINFQDNWWGTAYAPLTAPSAFEIPL